MKKLIFTPKTQQTPIQKAISKKLNFQRKPVIPSRYNFPSQKFSENNQDDNTA